MPFRAFRRFDPLTTHWESRLLSQGRRIKSVVCSSAAMLKHCIYSVNIGLSSLSCGFVVSYFRVIARVMHDYAFADSLRIMFTATSQRVHCSFVLFSFISLFILTIVYYEKRCSAHRKKLYLLRKSLLYFKYLVNALYIAVFQKGIKTDVQYKETHSGSVNMQCIYV